MFRQSNIGAHLRLLTALQGIERLALNDALPCAAHLGFTNQDGNAELWQKLQDAAIAAREFLNNHNLAIEPMRREATNV